jgi:GNAT superfamily N-acetyltransferase
MTTDSAKSFRIVPATEKDVPLLLTLICEFSEHVKLRHHVVATEELLRRSLFGEDRRGAEALIGYAGNQPVGFAVFFHNFSTFLGKPGLYIEDIYVRPQVRGKGYGKAMFGHLLNLARTRRCGRMEWSCLDWNERAITFYKKMGAIAQDDSTTYRIVLHPEES